MELFLPDQIALDDASRTLIQDVAETARRVNELRPLPGHVVMGIQEELVGERVYSSNAIEGNTLDLRETVEILKAGVASDSRKREGREALNLAQAIEMIQSAVAGDDLCYSPEFFLSVHGRILKDINDEWAGRIRDKRVMITGAEYQPPDHTAVPALIDRVMNRLKDDRDTCAVLLAAWAHWAIARIHPFMDGNGRVARLWQDLVLFRGGLTAAIIRPEDRRSYLDALAEADGGEFNPLVQMVAQRVSITFDKYLTALGEDRQREAWADELVEEADPRFEAERKVEYLRWSRKMEELRFEFELCAAKINDRSREVRVQIRKYDLVDESRWKNIGLGVKTGQTWFFIAEFRRAPASPRRYVFFFGNHFWSDLDDDEEGNATGPCLLISEDDETGTAKRLDELEDFPISLREVFVIGTQFVRRRRDASSRSDVYDRDISALRIAQDFMREVVLARLS